MKTLNDLCRERKERSGEAMNGWAAWHPKHGFTRGAMAYSHLDEVVEHVKDLNEDEGTTNRTGWRAVKVRVERVEG